jgi:type II secretion system protein H
LDGKGAVREIVDAISPMALLMQTGRNRIEPRRPYAFTLIELILVMTIMVVIISLVMPNLKGFFRGRNLDNEALRFVALTRFAQSRAINEGLPVEIWVNPRIGAYGEEALSGYTETETQAKRLQYQLDSTLQITLTPPSQAVPVHSNYWSQTKAQALVGGVYHIRFQPDGFISDASPRDVYLRQGRESQIRISEAPTHLEYDINYAQPYGR